MKKAKTIPKEIAHEQFTLEQLNDCIGQEFTTWKIFEGTEEQGGGQTIGRAFLTKSLKDGRFYLDDYSVNIAKAYGKSAQWMKDEKGFGELFCLFYVRLMTPEIYEKMLNAKKMN